MKFLQRKKKLPRPQIKPSSRKWSYYLKRDWQLYLMVMFPLAFLFIFQYGAYPGLRMAFMNYLPAKGFDGSEWVGMEIFQRAFKDPDFKRALRNTLVFNVLDVLMSFPMPIIIALLLNELRFAKFKKISQTLLYLPHFISYAIIGGLFLALFRTQTGMVNNVLVNWGIIGEGGRIPFITENFNWMMTYLLTFVWRGMGWNSIIYLASITNISPELYEAAMIDGANRWKRIIYITLPAIKGTIVMVLIMTLGQIFASNYEKISAMSNINIREVSYQLSVYIYEKGLASGGGFSIATAVGLFQSLSGLLLVIVSDRIAKSLGEDGLI